MCVVSFCLKLFIVLTNCITECQQIPSCWANDKWSENTLFLHILGCVVFISTYVRTFKNGNNNNKCIICKVHILSPSGKDMDNTQGTGK